MRWGAVSPRVLKDGLTEKVPSKERPCGGEGQLGGLPKSCPGRGSSQGNSPGV